MTGNVNVTIPGAGQPAKLARLVKSEFPREVLGTMGREDLGLG